MTSFISLLAILLSIVSASVTALQGSVGTVSTQSLSGVQDAPRPGDVPSSGTFYKGVRPHFHA